MKQKEYPKNMMIKCASIEDFIAFQKEIKTKISLSHQTLPFSEVIDNPDNTKDLTAKDIFVIKTQKKISGKFHKDHQNVINDFFDFFDDEYNFIDGYDEHEEWMNHWKDMPEFVNPAETVYSETTIILKDESEEKALKNLIGHNSDWRGNTIWFPKKDNIGTIWVGEAEPKYPIYVPSYKRAGIPEHTAKTLDSLGVSYYLVVEPWEYDEYAKQGYKGTILTLPFSNLGRGSIPVRNWMWRHSIRNGDKRHWQLDDNIDHFCRLNRNRRIYVADGTIFRCIEDFVDRYENVGFAGMNYRGMATQSSKLRAFKQRAIYSCTLIKNDLYRKIHYRGLYNEDTDIGIRAMKNKYACVMFNAFLCNKVGRSGDIKGGNSDIYGESKRDKFFLKSLERQHLKDEVRDTIRHGKNHHVINYTKWEYPLIRKNDIEIKDGINEYGMRKVKR